MAGETSHEYDSVLIVDLSPCPNYPHTSYETLQKCGLDEGKVKLSRNFRLRPLRLPIYEEEHLYHVIAKIDKRCTTSDKDRAKTAVNNHITNGKKARLTMDAIILSVVEAFPSRVVKGLDFSANNEPMSKYGTSKRAKVNTQFSSSETEAAMSAVEKMGKYNEKAKKSLGPRKRPRAVIRTDATPATHALPHNGDPTSPFTVVASSPGPNSAIPDLSALIGQVEITIEDHYEEVPATPLLVPTPPQVRISAPPAKKQRIQDGAADTDADNCLLSAMNKRLEDIETKVNSNLVRIHKGIMYLTSEVEKFRDEYSHIGQRLDNVTEDKLIKKMTEHKKLFPVHPLHDIEQYLEQDPQTKLLIER